MKHDTRCKVCGKFVSQLDGYLSTIRTFTIDENGKKIFKREYLPIKCVNCDTDEKDDLMNT